MENENVNETTNVATENDEQASTTSSSTRNNEQDNTLNAPQEIIPFIPDYSESDDCPNNIKFGAEDHNMVGTCTLKEILSEIMDCSVVRNPASTSIDKESCFEPRPDKGLSQLFPSSHSQTGVCSIKEIIDRILNYKVCPSSDESSLNSNIEEKNIENSEAGCSGKCQSELGLVQKEFQIFRTLNTNTIKSESAVFTRIHERPVASPPLKSIGHLLPSYSAVLRQGPPIDPTKFIKSVESSLSFIPRQPPPSYAEVEGIWEDLQSMVSSESVIFGPDPIYIVCPVCRRVVVTHTDQERSHLTHFAAIIMCVCFCWPCCLLPYCFRSCYYTYHSCPNCHHYFGMHRPF